jgi:type VI secretion system secreted protein VgrG
MEVVVQFIEGDPDRPLVTGCVYNGTHPTPHALPAEKTRSAIRTSSSPGGDGYNELRFEDLAGREEVFFHAQRDHNEVVERHHAAEVRGDQSVHVVGHQRVRIDGRGEAPEGMPAPGASLTVDGEYNVLVTKAYLLQVGTGTATIKSDNNYLAFKSTGDMTHDTDSHLVMRAKGSAVLGGKFVRVAGEDEVRLHSGGSKVSIKPDGIVLESGGSSISIKPGGIKVTSDGPVEVKGSLITLN